MKNVFVRTALSWLLSISVAAAPSLAWSKSEPKQKKDVTYTREEVERISGEAALRYAVLEYQVAGTPERYADIVLPRLSKEDQKTYKQMTQGLRQLPRITQNGRTFILKDAQESVTVEVVNVLKNQFRVNGRLWTYDPRTPLKTQLEVLKRNYPWKKSEWVYNQMVPRAEAIEPVTLIIVAVLTAGVTTAINMFSTVLCDQVFAWTGFNMTRMGVCKEWEASRKEAMNKDAPRLDAIEKVISSDKTNVLGKFEIQREMSCPDNNDGKERFYRATVKVKETGEPINVEVTFTPEGKAKSFKATDAKNNRDLAKIEFDNENFMTCASVPNPTTGTPAATPITPKNINLCRSQATLTSEQAGELKLLEDLAKYVNLRVARCTVQSAAEEVAKGKDIGSPVQPNPPNAPNAPNAPNTPNQGPGTR
ncbi:MAG: hypothetical protein KF681_05780 [Bdellovibrionaceae bacterium]|nr:hypothetical protein [Pseudobdellovibrionaceae bacterium]